MLQLRSELTSKETEIESLKLTLKTQGVEKRAENADIQQAAGNDTPTYNTVRLS